MGENFEKDELESQPGNDLVQVLTCDNFETLFQS